VSEPGLSVVVYAQDVERVAAFYATVLGVDRATPQGRFALLVRGGVEVVVHEVPPQVAAQHPVTDPPERREDAAVKVTFPVDSIARVRAAAPALGAVVDGDRHGWSWRGTRRCDGHDPEGNVVQLSELAG
jgi:catechol 2,3-dioxygenase-like lactoylglutathione lyase family enzyme